MSNRNKSYEGVFRVLGVGEEKVFPSGFRRIEMLVTDDDPRFPTTLPIDFANDRVDKALAFQPGDHVAISFSIAGHEYNGRHFITLRGFKIERAVKLGGESTVGPQPTAPAAAPAPAPVQPTLPVQDAASLEDLPF